MWEMKGQALAIAAVVAAGVAMFVAYLSNFESLDRTRTAYFARERLADVFASLTRAPTDLQTRLAAIPGVETVSLRVVADVTLDVPGLSEPASGRLVSIPEHGEPLLYDVYLRRGRWIDATRTDEVLVNELFAEANALEPGDRVGAIINGRHRWLRIAGVALSPEYLYAVRAGEMIPDRKRFGVLWMGQHALASAFDMDGAFNDVSLGLARGASADAVITRLDRLLEPYGGLGAIPQRLQMSAWALANELNQLRMFGFITPLIFLGVAAFILHVALTRALALQRPQIAALKALGYTNRELAWHFTKWALLIAATGAISGVLFGGWLGAAMIDLYNVYFRFPELDYQLSSGVALASVAGSLAVAALGAQVAVRRAVAVPPAEAMRPEAPEHYRRSIVERAPIQAHVPLAARIVLRNIARQPARATLSVLGIAFAVAVLVVGLAFLDVMNLLIDQQFERIMRQDATLTFARPTTGSAIHDIAHLPGVIDVEAMRLVPVRLRSGHRTRTVAIMATDDQPRLNRLIDRRGRSVTRPGEGLVLSRMLAEVLDIGPGGTLRVEVLEGARPAVDLDVAALVDDTLGLQAYLPAGVVRRLLREAGSVSGAHVTIDPSRLDAFYARLKGMPAVAGVALRDVTRRNFREAMAENMYLVITFNVAFAAVIAFGVVYNAARVSLSERARELASLRVLGFTRADISHVLLGELALITVLALPVGALIGYVLGQLVMVGFNNEVYRLTFVMRPATVAWAWLTVIAAAVVSGMIVRQRLDALDLVAVLKTRE